MLTNVITPAQVRGVEKMLDWARKFVIVTHKSPDGDAVGSSLAWWHTLKQMGKEVRVLVPDAFPDYLQWMPGASEITRFDRHADECTALINEADVVCCLDFNVLSRIKEMGDVVAASRARRLLIDHHLSPSQDFDVAISFPKLSSTCELVFRLICRLGAYCQMTKETAKCICAGILTDTGGLTYNSNSRDLYIIMAQLMEKGIDKDAIYRRVFNNYSQGRLRMMGFVLYEKMRLFPKYHTALITLTKEEMERFQFIKGDTEGFVNIPFQIRGTLFSVFLREDTEQPDKIHVSLRSVGGFPCNKVAAEFFNGGGHQNASGGELHATLPQAVEVFKAALEKYRQPLTGEVGEI